MKWLYLRDFESYSDMIKEAEKLHKLGFRVFLFLDTDTNIKEFKC